MKDIKEILETELNATLKDLGHQAAEAKNEIQHFLTSIEDDLAKAVAAGDERTLKYLRSAVSAKLGRVSLKLLYRERQQVINVVMTVVRVFIALTAAA